jgi:hypothetical protein
MKTLFGLNVERARRRNPEEELGPEAALMAELRALLPAEPASSPRQARPLLIISSSWSATGAGHWACI